MVLPFMPNDMPLLLAKDNIPALQVTVPADIAMFDTEKAMVLPLTLIVISPYPDAKLVAGTENNSLWPVLDAMVSAPPPSRN
jgi:hypothetical protein